MDHLLTRPLKVSAGVSPVPPALFGGSDSDTYFFRITLNYLAVPSGTESVLCLDPGPGPNIENIDLYANLQI